MQPKRARRTGCGAAYWILPDMNLGGMPPGNATEDARRAAGRFAVGVGAVRPFGGGHINETFLVGTPTGDLVFLWLVGLMCGGVLLVTLKGGS